MEMDFRLPILSKPAFAVVKLVYSFRLAVVFLFGGTGFAGYSTTSDGAFVRTQTAAPASR